MLICDTSYIPSAKQIIFMKFVKSYYQKYQNRKVVKKVDLNQKPSEDMLKRFNLLWLI